MEKPKRGEECVHTEERPSLRFPKPKAEDSGVLNRITGQRRGVAWHGLLEPKQGEGDQIILNFPGKQNQ